MKNVNELQIYFLLKKPTSFQKSTHSSDHYQLIANYCTLTFFKFFTRYGKTHGTTKHAYNFLVSITNYSLAIFQE